MSNLSKKKFAGPQGGKEADQPVRKPGRKRDHARDPEILAAAIDVLAEVGFDCMTMDMVAARAKAGKATVYRRWASKSEMVREALAWMNRSHLDPGRLPDTGSLRGDLLALVKPQSVEARERKLRILAGLGSFLQQGDFAESEKTGVFEPLIAVNRALMQRAVERGELPAHADIETACRVVVAMAAYRGLIESRPFDRHFFASLIDSILLPALKAGRD